ncbi:hypothetical protein I3843_06G001600 [Carya illinoinensis]|nr:hypothetical protein I3843_06G001600 [Carya illinoinensis]
MGSVEAIEEEREFDVEETIFVAVGKNVEESKTTLFWAVQNFVGKKICVLHVHQPEHVVEPTDINFSAKRLKQPIREELWEVKHQKQDELLDQYLLLLVQAGVEADKIWIEMNKVEKGIVDTIAAHNIRWLAMGGAAEKHYSEELSELKSKKAFFVCQQAPISCHVWFVCKGRLIYTRGGSKDSVDLEIASPLLLLGSDIENEQLQNSVSESFTNECNADAEGDGNELERISRSLTSQCSVCSSSSTNRVVGTSKLALWLTEEAKALENLCATEMSRRKEIEEALAGEKQEVERMRNQQDKFLKELQMVQDQKSVLEDQLEESQSIVKELEEKIISAVKLLISFKEKRDKLRIENVNAVTELRKLRRVLNGEVPSFCSVQIPAFSFMEINEATHNFDPTWKIAEGRYGSVYKGILRHIHVAIKMLPSYGCQSQLDFQNEVELLSRVRHPNLLTLIGTCPESRSLVYEHVENGSLEDRLACKGNTCPLPWQIRTKIAADICSTLIFLHSNKPHIVHGNLKPSKVLLDANFVCKLGDVGILCMVPQNGHPSHTTQLCNNSEETSLYMDPDYLETGKLTPVSDVYSFGLILLRLLTGRPILRIMKDVECALENENLEAVLDISAGDWPLKQAKQLAQLGLRCCEKNQLNRPDLVSEIWSLLEQMRASCIASASCLVSKKSGKIPSNFMCPIYQEVMTDPQIAADGYTYESEAIRGWFESGHNTSPMTNLKLQHCDLVPNYALQNAILEWQQHL